MTNETFETILNETLTKLSLFCLRKRTNTQRMMTGYTTLRLPRFCRVQIQ